MRTHACNLLGKHLHLHTCLNMHWSYFLLGTKHLCSSYLRWVIKQHSALFNMKTMKTTFSLLSKLSWASIQQYPTNSSLSTLMSVNANNPTAVFLYCVPLLAEESVFHRLSIKSQCQDKEHMFSPEKVYFLFAFSLRDLQWRTTSAQMSFPGGHILAVISLCLCRWPWVLLSFEMQLYLTEKHCFWR